MLWTAPGSDWRPAYLNRHTSLQSGTVHRRYDREHVAPELPITRIHRDAYGQAWNVREESPKVWPVRVVPFDAHRLAVRCIICQPASLIRRSAWEAAGGLDEDLHMAMDYDLWWRLYHKFGPLGFIDTPIAINRHHYSSKTLSRRREHYAEAIKVLRRHYGRIPPKWWIAQPYAVWFKALVARGQAINWPQRARSNFQHADDLPMFPIADNAAVVPIAPPRSIVNGYDLDRRQNWAVSPPHQAKQGAVADGQ